MVSEVGQQPDALEATDRRYVEAKIPVELGRIHGSAAKARRIQPRKSKREILVSVKKEAPVADHNSDSCFRCKRLPLET
jgi:hypothetical protein